MGRTARGHFFLIYQSIARSTPPGCVGAAIPSAPLSLRLAPAATAVVEMVVVCKCKCKQNSRNLCFGLPAVDDFAHGGIDSSNRGEFDVYDKKGGFNASLSCLKFVQRRTTNLEGKACLPQCGSVSSLVRPQMLSSLPLRCKPEQSSRTIRTYPGCNWRNPEKPNVKPD